ncbi:hypothetical protein EV193_10611 [Herbihabitans rhizosphaerae]|uniref:Uncharacterized protein n=1 Tax=Herbihabitans rhizosphaerae TaxID=1872711 RepID=A0A4Q7KKM5_9PSEU|nr:hypothetical protein [Herbihabitans rhizosphaerae]RZS36777.1 hypothetical protein EV193_10611 [Herbihabitans rhizosphaerae]
MRTKTITLVAVFVAVLAGLLISGTASATRPPSLIASPVTVKPGGIVQFKSYCPAPNPPASAVSSSGLDGAVTMHPAGNGEYAGQGKAIGQAGTYTASIKCPDWTSPVTAKFTIGGSSEDCYPEPGSTGSCGFISVVPQRVQAGDKVEVNAGCRNDANAKPASSALRDFALTSTRHWSATVTGKSGTHSVSVKCPERTYSASFTVSGSDTKQAPTQVVEVPVGGVETGGGIV